MPSIVDKDIILKNLSNTLQRDISEEFSFTLLKGPNPNSRRDSFTCVDKIVLSFSNECDYSAWYDGLQLKVKDVISLSHLELSSYTLFQIYSLLAINNGISFIERDLMDFQPPIPELPPGPEHYTVKDSSKPIVHRQSIARRNTTWIEDINDVFDLDKMVDAKLSQLDKRSSLANPITKHKQFEENNTSQTNNNKNSWIRTSQDVSKKITRKQLLARGSNKI